MPQYRISQAASLLGVSDDTVRRWIDSGRLRGSEGGGVTTIDGAELAALAQEIARTPELGSRNRESARNRFTGLVTKVVKDTVMAQVDLQCGPFRVVSLMSAEAAEDLGLEPGVLAVASVKSTHVVVEVPRDSMIGLAGARSVPPRSALLLVGAAAGTRRARCASQRRQPAGGADHGLRRRVADRGVHPDRHGFPGRSRATL